ncbi:hypothetical protein SAMN05443543_101223 [Flavobacterium flevense]|uniref:Uncharacterized protein n=1 Tax=Flavobacterium flevense TaxID=983 RepID=A0A4Y4AXX8_9FLAO|nr:hypothetical protein [Flavobacterium flevense]GEC73125.1 hypothetical protein FFL01_26640 [Flavobacterium flevense]SHL30196.1 hypothetical protein SAMN05443543_101223 [Flavobacterium flevense]
MNIEAHKNQIIKRLKDVQDEKNLEQVDAVLNGNPILAYTAEGESLTASQYIERIENISDAVADGAQTYTSEQVRASILS